MQFQHVKIIQKFHPKSAVFLKSKTIWSHLNRDHRIVKKLASNPASFNGRSDKGKSRRISIVSPRMVKRMKRVIRRNPFQTSNEIFKAVPNMPKSTRCHILKSISKYGKPLSRRPLKSVHREKRLKWAENNLKVNFENAIFTDECRATLDGSDGRSRGCYDAQFPSPQGLRHQQGGGGIMFWAGIMKNEIVGPFRVKDGVKIPAETYTTFLRVSTTLVQKEKFVIQEENDIYARHCTFTCCSFNTAFLDGVVCKKCHNHGMATKFPRSQSDWIYVEHNQTLSLGK